MKFVVIFLVIFSLKACAPLHKRIPASGDHTFHIVFDLDWTLISEVEHPELHPQDELVHHNGLSYRIGPHTREIIEKLSDKAELYVFSGGDRERNVSVLKQIKLSNGTTLFDRLKQVFSKDDLLDLSNEVEEGAGFSDRYKKDLKRLGFNLDQTILIDDNYMFAAGEEQRRNILWLGETYKVIEDYRDIGKHVGDKYIPKNYTEWFSARNKLLAVSYVLERAIEESAMGKESFPDLVQRESVRIGLDQNGEKLGPLLLNQYLHENSCSKLIFNLL